MGLQKCSSVCFPEELGQSRERKMGIAPHFAGAAGMVPVREGQKMGLIGPST